MGIVLALIGLGIYNYSHSSNIVGADNTITLSDDIGSKADSNVTTSNVGNAWALFGDGDGFSQELTSSSYSASYSSANTKISSATAKAVQGAANFGYQLYSSGLDHSYSGGDATGTFSMIGRILGGAVIFVGFLASSITSWGFNLIVELANDLNVFSWIANASSLSDSNPFKGMAERMSTLYGTIQSFGIVFATFMFLFSVMIAIFGVKFRGVGTGLIQSFTKWLMKAFILFGATLMLSGCYTSILNYLTDAYATPSASAYAVYSNIVDFQDWAEHSRLAWPSGMSSNLNNSNSSSYIATHGDIIKINEFGAGLKNAKDINDNTSGYTQLTNTDNTKVPSITTSMATMSFVWSWMSFSKYKAADWNSYVQAQQNKSSKEISASKLSNDGSYKVGSSSGSTTGNLSVGSSDDVLTSNAASYDSAAKLGSSSNAGLSSVSLYNYLLTVFDGSGFTITTSAKLSNLYSVPYHTTFGLAGRGLVAMGNYLIMIALIYAVAIIAIFFMLYAIRAIIKGVPEIFGRLFTTGMSGSPIQFLSLIMAFVVLVIDLFGGAALYALANDLIIGLASFGDSSVNGATSGFTNLISPLIMHASSVKSAGLATTASINSTTYAAANVFEAVLIMFAAGLLVKFRGKILGSIGEAVEGGIKKTLSFADNRVANKDNVFGQGGKGLNSTDNSGNNIFARNWDGDANGNGSGGSSSSQSGAGRSGALGDGNGLTHTDASDQRGTRIADPKTRSARKFNKEQTLNDADAGGYGMGRKAYKKAHRKAQMVDGLGVILGSNYLRNKADDMEDQTQAQIDNDLGRYRDAQRSGEADDAKDTSKDNANKDGSKGVDEKADAKDKATKEAVANDDFSYGKSFANDDQEAESAFDSFAKGDDDAGVDETADTSTEDLTDDSTPTDQYGTPESNSKPQDVTSNDALDKSQSFDENGNPISSVANAQNNGVKPRKKQQKRTASKGKASSGNGSKSSSKSAHSVSPALRDIPMKMTPASVNKFTPEKADNAIQSALSAYHGSVGHDSAAVVAKRKQDVNVARGAAAKAFDQRVAPSSVASAGRDVTNGVAQASLSKVQSARSEVAQAKAEVASVGGTVATEHLKQAQAGLVSAKRSAITAGLSSKVVNSKKATKQAVSSIASNRQLAKNGLSTAVASKVVATSGTGSENIIPTSDASTPQQSNMMVNKAIYDADTNHIPQAQARFKPALDRQVKHVQKVAKMVQLNAPTRSEIGRGGITNREVITHLRGIQKAQAKVANISNPVLAKKAQRALDTKINAAKSAGIKSNVLKSNSSINGTLKSLNTDVIKATQGMAPTYDVDRSSIPSDGPVVLATSPDIKNSHVSEWNDILRNSRTMKK